MSYTAIPICPLISSGSDFERVCAQEKCAWYVKSYKTCAMYVLAHNAALDIKSKHSPDLGNRP